MTERDENIICGVIVSSYLSFDEKERLCALVRAQSISIEGAAQTPTDEKSIDDLFAELMHWEDEDGWRCVHPDGHRSLFWCFFAGIIPRRCWLPGACGVTYYRCRSCEVGIDLGSRAETHHGQCGGHQQTACAETCFAALALAEVKSLRAAREAERVALEELEVLGERFNHGNKGLFVLGRLGDESPGDADGHYVSAAAVLALLRARAKE